MLERFSNHNLHWADPATFAQRDPHLSRLQEVPLIAPYRFLEVFPVQTPGIYTLSGGRQLGKTTCLKQLMLIALQDGVKPEHVFYLACDVILDRSELYEVLKYFLESHKFERGYLLIDEVTFVKDWDLTIKAIADEGLLRNVVCCLSGSDKIILEDAISRLPGRRGTAPVQDFELKPLIFPEVIVLLSSLPQWRLPLEELFMHYLKTGGYIVAVNELVRDGEISLATYRTYQQWVVGDFIRLHRTQRNLLQILFSIINTYGSQVSFQTLSEHTDGLSKDTVNEYCGLLERLGVISIQYALDQNTLRAAPRKHRKVHMLDPFIAHAMHQLVCERYQRVADIDESLLVESVCYHHYQRKYPSYYIKAEGEVDIAYIDKKRFFPVEIKWRNKLRAKDLKQIKKYENGLILSRQEDDGIIDGVPVTSLIKHLAGFKVV